MIVNLSGAFVIGPVQEVGRDALLIPDRVRIFLTYSTFSYETVRLMEADAWPQAWISIIITAGICLCLCFLGIASGRFLLSVRG